MSDIVLEFDEVAIEGGYPYDTGLWEVSFKLGRGELLLVHLESGHLRVPLADAALGLADPVQGTIRFAGSDWQEATDQQLAKSRSCIGRVFDEPGWLSELDMEDNITLLQRHHSNRAEADIRDEASELARLFSLPGLPQGNASATRLPDLRRAACVRAFLGRPELLVLERPAAGVYPDIMPALMTCISVARGRGAAVLWTTAELELWNDPGIRPTFRASMSGSQMTILAGA